MSTKTYMPRLADRYKKDVVPALVKKFGLNLAFIFYSLMQQRIKVPLEQVK